MNQIRSIIIISVFSINLIQNKLLHVIELFRHGARGPLYPLYDWKDQEHFMGQLTPGGMRQHYELGRALRKEYIDKQNFLSPTFNHTEFKIFSTDVNRTIESAQSQLLGFFPIGSGLNLPEYIDRELTYPPFKGVDYKKFDTFEGALPQNFQALPVRSVAQEEIFISTTCPNRAELRDQNVQQNKQIYDQMQQRMSPLMKKYSKILSEYQQEDIQLKTTDDLWNVYDNLMSNKFQERQLPQELTDEDYKQLQLTMSFEWLISYGSGQYNKIATTEFFRFLINNFQEKAEKLDKMEQKYVMLSAHDTNIVNVLGALGLTDMHCIIKKFDNKLPPNQQCLDIPTYASNLLFELHQNENNNENYIKLKYQGEYVQICGNQDYTCSLEQFRQEREEYMIDNPQKECGFIEVIQQQDQVKYEQKLIKDGIKSNIMELMIILLSIVVVTMGILVFFKSKQINNLKQTQQQKENTFQTS